jgi:hypothetical protein
VNEVLGRNKLIFCLVVSEYKGSKFILRYKLCISFLFLRPEQCSPDAMKGDVKVNMVSYTEAAGFDSIGWHTRCHIQ